MKTLLFGFILLLSSTSRSIAQAGSQNTHESIDAKTLAEARRAIDKGNIQWCEGWKKGDPAMVTAIFAADGFVLSSSGKIIKGYNDIFNIQKKAMQSVDPGVRVTVKTVNVWIVADGAYETGTYVYEYNQKGKPGKDKGHYATLWKKQKDGSWKLYMDMTVSTD